MYSAAEDPGETVAIIAVFARPVNASRSTCVSFEPRKGTWAPAAPPESMARMHSLRQRSDLLMSAPSARVSRSASPVSAARSDPARSTSVSLPAARERRRVRELRQKDLRRIGVARRTALGLGVTPRDMRKMLLAWGYQVSREACQEPHTLYLILNYVSISLSLIHI